MYVARRAMAAGLVLYPGFVQAQDAGVSDELPHRSVRNPKHDFYDETQDRDWARAAESRVTDVVGGHSQIASLSEMECRSTTCRASLVVSGRADARFLKELDTLATGLKPELQALSIERQADGSYFLFLKLK